LEVDMPRTKTPESPLIGELRAMAGDDGLEAGHVELLALADARARAFLAINGALLSSDGTDRFNSLVIDLARQHEPDRYAEAEKKLEKLDEAIEKTFPPGALDDLDSASDAAANLYTEQIDAAYYLGLAIGLRLGGAR
jgi:hypothetical protein